jgi:hypothetical protein
MKNRLNSIACLLLAFCRRGAGRQQLCFAGQVNTMLLKEQTMKTYSIRGAIMHLLTLVVLPILFTLPSLTAQALSADTPSATPVQEKETASLVTVAVRHTLQPSASSLRVSASTRFVRYSALETLLMAALPLQMVPIDPAPQGETRNQFKAKVLTLSQYDRDLTNTSGMAWQFASGRSEWLPCGIETTGKKASRQAVSKTLPEML